MVFMWISLTVNAVEHLFTCCRPSVYLLREMSVQILWIGRILMEWLVPEGACNGARPRQSGRFGTWFPCIQLCDFWVSAALCLFASLLDGDNNNPYFMRSLRGWHETTTHVGFCRAPDALKTQNEWELFSWFVKVTWYGLCFRKINLGMLL